MARVKSHTWDNRHELRKNGRYSGWTRRLTWYCAGWDDADRSKDVRVRFEDETGEQNLFYRDDSQRAEADWAAFKDGSLTVALIVERERPRRQAIQNRTEGRT